MSLRESLHALNSAILSNRLDEVAAALATMEPQTDADRRMLTHYHAQLDLKRGQVLAAKNKLQEALNSYGENVNLLRDLIVCQYRLQDMLGFRANLEKLEHALIDHEASLSNESLLACELVIGKLLEEDARIAPALLFYDRALKRAEKPAHRLRALIQKGRWHALYEPTPELSTYYRELISVPPNSTTEDLRAELEHSLMLIELRLVGSDHSWLRIQRLGGEVASVVQRLLIFDYIEGVLSQDLEMNAAVNGKVSEFDDLDPFEDFLRKLVKESLEPVAMIHELTLLASQLPWAAYLRLLCISANRENSQGIRQELHRKIQLIVCSLDSESQAIWARRLRQAMQSPEIRLEFSGRSRSLRAHGKHVDLSKKKIGLQLLEALLTKPSITVDEAIQLLWQSSFSPEHYHRLRMSVHRLNTLINDALSVGKVLEVDSQNVRLRPEVKMRQSDEAFDLGMIGRI